MKKKWLWLLSLSVTLTLNPLLSPGAMAAEDQKQVSQTEAASKLETLASQKASLLTEQYGVTSVQYALLDGEELVLSGVSGIHDAEGQISLTPQTMYGIGSTSKMFTAASVMKLVEQGKLQLDTPLIQYMPDFTMKDERYKQITPRMLLNHSSGLHGSTLANAFLFEDHDTAAHDNLLSNLSKQTLKAQPGAYSVYSNDSFTLAELLVERVSGQSFTAFIHQHFTEPLKLEHTKTPQDQLEDTARAGIFYPGFDVQLPDAVVNAIGTGGIYSTAEDLVKFSKVFTGGAESVLSFSSAKIMAQEEYKKGMWPKDADNSIDYGLGWDSVRLFPFENYGIQALAKGGDAIVYHASLIVLPEHDMAAAVLSSGGSSALNQIMASELLLQQLKAEGEIQAIQPEKSFGKPVPAPMPKEVMDVAGRYVSTNQVLQATVKEEGRLILTMPIMPELPAQEYVYTKDGSFLNDEGTVKITFVTESNGRTYIWVQEYASAPGLGQMATSLYSGEKLQSHKLDEASAAAWEQREGLKYYPLNEKYSSMAYFLQEPSIAIVRDPSMKGYLLDKKITGPNTARSQHEVPGVGSRDTMDFSFYKQQGKEYLEAAGTLFVSGDSIKGLYAGKRSKVTIGNDGYARWFTIPAAAAGKAMKVALPLHSAFAVYDGQGACLYYSIISGNQAVKLPENGSIVFLGAAGSAFDVTLSP
ncbi:serine hydrolase domain-containing protein [Paenibacillus sp. JSM ZJ436]|uniref:serine hydrolase domain-containing protein n=1 Tax=Paenibacillus sp. JSM ZJ436 TaxID=3376190 RepID=UPI00378B0246